MHEMPEKVLAQYSKKYPNAWKTLERFFLSRGKNGLSSWPPYVFVPVAGAYAVVSGGQTLQLQNAPDIPVIAALGAWRPTQSIYEFHPTLLSELLKTRLTGDLPTEVLHRIPEWCVYIRTPGCPCQGFWAHLEWDLKTHEEELRLLLHFEDGLFPVIIHLVGTLKEGLDKAWEVSSKYVSPETIKLADRVPSAVNDAFEHLEGFISCLLYLCSSEPEFSGTSRPSMPSPKKTKKGIRLFPAPGPRVIKTGLNLGKRLEAATSLERTPKERKSPRPHIRRGHWHHYWTGPQKGPRKLIVRWIYPLLVGKHWEALNETPRESDVS